MNCHFGGKRRLYDAVPEDLVDRAERRYPLDTGLSPRAGPRDRLRAFIRAFLFRTLDEGRPAWHGRLMVREMAEPVALDGIVSRTVRPTFAHLLAILSALLPGATPRVLEGVAGSVFGQVVFHRLALEAVKRVFPERTWPSAEIERLADRIARFTLAALPRFRRPCSASLTAACAPAPTVRAGRAIAVERKARGGVDLAEPVLRGPPRAGGEWERAPGEPVTGPRRRATKRSAARSGPIRTGR